MKKSKYLTGGVGVVLIFLLAFMISKCNTCRSNKSNPVAVNIHHT